MPHSGDLKPLTADERAGAAAEAKRLAASGPALAELLGQTLPRVLEDLSASRREVDSLRAALDKEQQKAREKTVSPSSRSREVNPRSLLSWGDSPVPPEPPRPARTEREEEQAEAAGALLAAPFRVTAKAAAAARTDPLSALAVQVAKALSPDASPVERARLIAMAFAASQGDLEAFWTARRQRKGAAKPNRPIALRKK